MSISDTSASLTEVKIKHVNTEITKLCFAEFAIRYLSVLAFLVILLMQNEPLFMPRAGAIGGHGPQRAGTDPCTTSGSALFRCSSFLAYTPNWPVALFLLLLHPPGTLYLLKFDCAKTFSLSNAS